MYPPTNTRDLSIAGMYIQSRQEEIYQSPACIYKADRKRSINRWHVYTKQLRIDTHRDRTRLDGMVASSLAVSLHFIEDSNLKVAQLRSAVVSVPEAFLREPFLLADALEAARDAANIMGRERGDAVLRDVRAA